jgi:hypothetical protein
VTITSPVLNGFVPTVRFGWTRNDTPGPGVDALLPSQFKAWCVDLSQPLAPDVTFSFDVVELAASGYTPTRADLLNGLFNEYFPIVNTAQESAAFQLAIWEILYDTDGSLDTGTFRATTQALTVSLANSWLANITSSAFERGIDQWRVLVLQKPVIQDQITAVRIPSPGVGVCAAGGLLLAAGGWGSRFDFLT